MSRVSKASKLSLYEDFPRAMLVWMFTDLWGGPRAARVHRCERALAARRADPLVGLRGTRRHAGKTDWHRRRPPAGAGVARRWHLRGKRFGQIKRPGRSTPDASSGPGVARTVDPDRRGAAHTVRPGSQGIEGPVLVRDRSCDRQDPLGVRLRTE